MGQAFPLTVGFRLHPVELLCTQSVKMFIRRISHCKQKLQLHEKNQLLVAKLQLKARASIVSKKDPKDNCKLKSSIASRKLPTPSLAM